MAAQTHLLCDFLLLMDSFVILSTLEPLSTGEVQGGGIQLQREDFALSNPLSSTHSPGLLHTSQMLRLLFVPLQDKGVFHEHFILRGAP